MRTSINKSNQRWTWYAIEIKSGCILAQHNGKRSGRDFLILWDMLKLFNIDCYYTDNWGHIQNIFHRKGTE